MLSLYFPLVASSTFLKNLGNCSVLHIWVAGQMWANPISIVSGLAGADGADLTPAPINSATNVAANKPNNTFLFIVLPPFLNLSFTFLFNPYHIISPPQIDLILFSLLTLT